MFFQKLKINFYLFLNFLFFFKINLIFYFNINFFQINIFFIYLKIVMIFIINFFIYYDLLFLIFNEIENNNISYCSGADDDAESMYQYILSYDSDEGEAVSFQFISTDFINLNVPLSTENEINLKSINDIVINKKIIEEKTNNKSVITGINNLQHDFEEEKSDKLPIITDNFTKKRKNSFDHEVFEKNKFHILKKQKKKEMEDFFKDNIESPNQSPKYFKDISKKKNK